MSTKETRVHHRKTPVSPASGVGNTGKLRVNHWLEHSTPYTKIKSKWFKVLNLRQDPITLLEENIGKMSSDIYHRKILFDILPRVMEIKIKVNKWDLIKLRSICKAKETINKIK